MKLSKLIALLMLPAFLLSFAGCENLPGTRGQQGAVIGGAGGAAAGAVIGGSQHRLLGALLGGALGAGGGYLIGAETGKIQNKDTAGAQTANTTAQSHPATAADVANSSTADLNKDGFVTMDEVVAMKQAGLTDQQMIDRLQATGQVFELTPQQRQFLLDHGVSQNVVDQMGNINRAARNQIPGQTSNVIGTQPANP